MNFFYGMDSSFVINWEEKKHDLCLIRIRDRGGGMPASLLEKIYDYHFSSNDQSAETSMLSFTDFDNHLYDQLSTKNSQHRMSG